MTKIPIKYFEDVQIDEPLPPLDMDVTLTALVMYAGATWDFHRYHYDPEFVAKLGMRAPFMDGQMLGALLARQLMRWGGPDAFVRRLNYRQRAMVYAGDAISIRGRVSGTAVEDGRALALCTLSVYGPESLIIARDAMAAVELSRRPQ
jgi:acyl dehydratase